MYLNYTVSGKASTLYIKTINELLKSLEYVFWLHKYDKTNEA